MPRPALIFMPMGFAPAVTWRALAAESQTFRRWYHTHSATRILHATAHFAGRDGDITRLIEDPRSTIVGHSKARPSGGGR
jgi:hypothetical protein